MWNGTYEICFPYSTTPLGSYFFHFKELIFLKNIFSKKFNQSNVGKLVSPFYLIFCNATSGQDNFTFLLELSQV